MLVAHTLRALPTDSCEKRGIYFPFIILFNTFGKMDQIYFFTVGEVKTIFLKLYQHSHVLRDANYNK